MEFKINRQRIDIRERDDPWYRRGNHDHERQSKQIRISQMEKHFDYDVNPNTCGSKVLMGMVQELYTKLKLYYGPKEYVKKMTRTDKRRAKEEHGVVLARNPILKRWKRVDDILRKKMLSALFSYNKYRNRYWPVDKRPTYLW